NTALVLGDVAGAVEHYDKCLASTAVGAGLDAVRQDAATNRQFALEQAHPSIAPQDESESDRDQSPSNKRNRPPGVRKRGDGGSDPTPDDSVGTDPRPAGSNSQGEADNRPAKGRRRAGGGGGASNLPPGSAGESPDDRLDKALDQICDAQRRRLPEDSPSESSGDGRKDW